MAKSSQQPAVLSYDIATIITRNIQQEWNQVNHMGNKINSLRGREEEELDDNGNVRARSISVGGGGSGSSIRAMSSSMSAPSGSR